MAKFETTDDVRASDEGSWWYYGAAYAFFFMVGYSGAELISYLLSFSDSDSMMNASLAEYLCTKPKKPPRFRSISRFMIAMFLSIVLAVIIRWLRPAGDSSVFSAAAKVAAMTAIPGEGRVSVIAERARGARTLLTLTTPDERDFCLQRACLGDLSLNALGFCGPQIRQ